jgi:hypothetical protein
MWILLGSIALGLPIVWHRRELGLRYVMVLSNESIT